MHGLFGINELPEAVSFVISYLTIIVIINSFNLIDGIDGLAASLGILTMIIFGSYFFYVGYQTYALLAYAMAGSLIAFLIFNHHPAKIFMGDSGSLLIGLVNAILVIKFINVASDPTVALPVGSAVAIGFSILIIPLLDTLRVFAIRIFNGRSPFTPDRNHIHHLLLNWGLGHSGVTLVCLGINIAFVVFAYFGRSLGSNYLLLSMGVIAFAGFSLLYYRKPRRTLVVAKRMESAALEIKPTSKIVTLTQEAATADHQ
jgi:UDP-N-acetylmuramyl pentapeptide phosphotransferase/UDP-N-acetylglucosamine-1-phosphate transferase